MKKQILSFFISVFLITISFVSCIGIWNNRQLFFKDYIVSYSNLSPIIESYSYDFKRMAEGLMSDEEYNTFLYKSPESYFYITNNETGKLFSNLPEGIDYAAFISNSNILQFPFQNTIRTLWSDINGNIDIAASIKAEIREYMDTEYSSDESAYSGYVFVDMDIVENCSSLGSMGGYIQVSLKRRMLLIVESVIFFITLTCSLLLFLISGRKALAKNTTWINKMKPDVLLLSMAMSIVASLFLLPRYIPRVKSYSLMTERIILYFLLTIFLFITNFLFLLLAYKLLRWKNDKQLFLEEWENRLTKSIPLWLSSFILLLCWYAVIVMSFSSVVNSYERMTHLAPSLAITHIILLFLFSIILQKINDRRVEYQKDIISMAKNIAGGHTEVEVPVVGSGYTAQVAQAINQIRSNYILSLEEVKKSEQLKYELVTNISHDLRTPLTLVLNYIDLLKRNEISEEKLHYIMQAENQAEKLHLLIDDLFELSKLESGNMVLLKEDTDIVLLWRQMIEDCQVQLAEQNLELVLEHTQAKIKLSCDSAKIWRVFDNLLQNAIKYSLPNTRL